MGGQTASKPEEKDIVELIISELLRQRELIQQIRTGQLIIHVSQNGPQPVKIEAHMRLT